MRDEEEGVSERERGRGGESERERERGELSKRGERWERGREEKKRDR